MAVKVLFVSSHARTGGSERHVETLVHGLGSEWVAGVVVLERGPAVGSLAVPGRPLAVIPTSGGRLSMLAAAVRLRRRVVALRPDVVHASGVKAAAVAAAAMVGSSVPLLWMKHDFSWDGRLSTIIAGRCREVVGVSHAVLEAIDPDVATAVVYSGVDVPEPDAESGRARLRELVGADEGPVVALVGRIHSVKGHRVLLDAMPALRRAHPLLRVAFVGGGDDTQTAYRDDLDRRIAAAGLEGAVTFLGHRSDVHSLIAGADVVVCPSVRDDRGFGREGAPLIVLETFAAGTPLVASSDGGIPELAGECAVLVPPGDAAALAGAVLDLLADRPKAEAFSRCGRRRVAEFTVAGMVDAMKARYRAAVA